MSAPAQLQLLDGIGNALEELLLAGTTTASQATQRTLAAAFAAQLEAVPLSPHDEPAVSFRPVE